MTETEADNREIERKIERERERDMTCIQLSVNQG